MGAARGEPDAQDDEIGPDGRPFPVEIQPFRIAAYPVTNAQFRPFVDSDGYQDCQYWTEAGWAWKEEFRGLCAKHEIEIDERYVWD